MGQVRGEQRSLLNTKYTVLVFQNVGRIILFKPGNLGVSVTDYLLYTFLVLPLWYGGNFKNVSNVLQTAKTRLTGVVV